MNSTQTASIWAVIRKEITGIQLLWRAVDLMYFQAPRSHSAASLEVSAPFLYRLVQTAFMESLLMRMSRLMDPATSGKGAGGQHNLSLARLIEFEATLTKEVDSLRQLWDASGLRSVRNKYMSHNDLERSTEQDHTISVPLTSPDIEVMRTLTSKLREFRRSAHHQLNGTAYLDRTVSTRVDRDVDGLHRVLTAGRCYYDLLPEHPWLQAALGAFAAKEAANRT